MYIVLDIGLDFHQRFCIIESMPTYTYKCQECGKFDIYQKFSDPTLESCPTCNSDVKKVFNVPGVVGMENVPTQVYRQDRSALWNSAQAE